MSTEDTYPIQMLLALKSKAASGISWTADEQAAIKRWLETKGDLGVLAACCVLASERLKELPRSLDVVREAIRRKRLPPYVELSVYEALIYVETGRLEAFLAEIISFVEDTVARRQSNFDNTMCLLGKLARAGVPRALGLLQSLARDSGPGIRQNAALVLRGVADR